MQKKNFVFAAVLTVCALVLFGCDKENLPESELLRDLISVNEDLSEELSSGATKADARKIAMIALADLGGAYGGGKAGAELGAELGSLLGNPITGGVFGAAVGALGVGAYSSWKESESQSTKSGNDGFNFDILVSLCEDAINGEDFISASPEMEEKIFVNESILENTMLNKESKNIGKMHNVVLAGLRGELIFDTKPKTKSNESTDESLELAILNSNEMKDLFSSHSYGNEVLDGSLSDSVLKLFNKIFEECARGSEDVSKIINKYQKVIESSKELSEEEKNNLSLAFGTALYSINFWQ